MKSSNNQVYNLYSDFDIQQHKKHYVNYLEVIMFPDGHIEYAVPSHQEKLIKICHEKLNLTRDELADMCPSEYTFFPTPWLCELSGCISIWTDNVVKGDNQELTNEQIQMLLTLKDEGLLVEHRD